MRAIVIICGIIFLLIGIIGIQPKIREYNVFYNGEKIQVVVDYVPICRTSKSIYFMEFSYQNKSYKKKLLGNWCDKLKKGDMITLITDKNRKTFMFEDEKPTREFFAIGFLIVLGVSSILMGFFLKSLRGKK